MLTPSRSARRHGSITRRVSLPLVIVASAALIAVGCGDGGDGGGSGEGAGQSGVVGDDGPMAWLPADTWLVASADLSADTIDEAVRTLDRLPAWSLAEGFLPASDGAGLRREGLEQIAEEASKDEKKGDVTAKQLEAAFGDRAGMAIVDNDLANADEDAPPIAVWMEVDDEDAATKALRALVDGKEREAEHEGFDYFAAKGSDGAFLVRDGLAIVAPTPKQLEALIDVHEGDSSLADDDMARAMVEASIGDSIAGFAVATDPVLEAIPDLVREDEDTTLSSEQVTKLERVLKSASVDGLVADWVGGSATIDSTGVRLRGAWSNPRKLADPDVGARELAERMPVDAPIVQAGATDGTMVGRAQEAWKDVRDEYDIDLTELGANCEPAEQWACDLGIQLALAALEDEQLAESAAEAGDASFAMVQDLSSLMSMATGAQPGAAGGAAPAPTLTSRMYEVAMTENLGLGDYTPPAGLVRAAVQAGLIVTPGADQLSVNVRVRPGSPMALSLRRELTPDAMAGLRAIGINIAPLLTPKGITLTAEQVDDIVVAGFPPSVPSKVVPALEGDVDTVADSENYQEVVEAAKPPKTVGQYGYIDLQAYVIAIVGAVTAQSPEAGRTIPTIRNNLADVPGALTWTSREEIRGTEVGIYETVIPILE